MLAEIANELKIQPSSPGSNIPNWERATTWSFPFRHVNESVNTFVPMNIVARRFNFSFGKNAHFENPNVCEVAIWRFYRPETRPILMGSNHYFK